MKKLYLFLTVLILFCTYRMSSASHIAGGDVTYRYIGNNRYAIQYIIYFDCINGLQNSIESDSTILLGFFYNNSQNVLYDTLRRGTPEYPTNVSYPCIILPSDFCIVKYTYRDTVTLPPVPGGYTISFQRCCRNQTILNIVNPSSSGVTFWTEIPDTANTGFNSSPVFDSDPPVFLCLNRPVLHDYSATDPDGDSLVYSLFTPFDAPNAIGAMLIPDPPPYTLINWTPGYSQANMMNTNPPLSIDPQTGIISVLPTQLGVFVIGVMVTEYRNGVAIGETRRDYQFNVINCSFSTTSAFSTPQVQCSRTVSFTNTSQSATSYEWNFGDPTTLTDTSTQFQPTYTYPDFGAYTITLIAADTSCADTFRTTIYLYDSYPLIVSADTSVCEGDTVQLQAIYPPATNPMFTWTPSTNISDPQLSNPQVWPAVTTLYLVEVVAGTCIVNDTVKVEVTPIPTAQFTYSELPNCEGVVIVLDNKSQNASGYEWFTNDNFLSPDANTSFQIDFSDTVTVKLVAKQTSCSDTSKFTLTPVSSTPISEPFPNIFTPGGDGINECFTISTSTDTLNCYGLYIYNRWGELFYDGTKDGTCWNGRVRNKGAHASPGVYYFLVYVGGEKKSAGTLTLVR